VPGGGQELDFGKVRWSVSKCKNHGGRYGCDIESRGAGTEKFLGCPIEHDESVKHLEFIS
jgi:hypothetical protein